MKKTRVEQAAETKQRIVETAAEILTTQGINGLTSGKLAMQLEMSKGTLFHHFDSMEDIHLAVLDSIIQSLTKEIEIAEFADAADFIEATINAAFRDNELYRGVYAALLFYIGHAEQNEGYRLKLKAMFDDFLTSWEKILAENVGNHISEQKLENAVRIIDMHFAGLMVHDLIFKDPQRYKVLTKDFFDQIVRYLEE